MSAEKITCGEFKVIDLDDPLVVTQREIEITELNSPEYKKKLEILRKLNPKLPAPTTKPYLTIEKLMSVSEEYEAIHKGKKLAHVFPSNDNTSAFSPYDQHTLGGAGLAKPYQDHQKGKLDSSGQHPPIWVTPVPATFFTTSGFNNQRSMIKHYIAGLYFQAGRGNGICVPVRSIDSYIGSIANASEFEHPKKPLGASKLDTNKEFAWGAGVDAVFCGKHGNYLEEELNKLDAFMYHMNKADNREKQDELIRGLDEQYKAAFEDALKNKEKAWYGAFNPTTNNQKNTPTKFSEGISNAVESIGAEKNERTIKGTAQQNSAISQQPTSPLSFSAHRDTEMLNYHSWQVLNSMKNQLTPEQLDVLRDALLAANQKTIHIFNADASEKPKKANTALDDHRLQPGKGKDAASLTLFTHDERPQAMSDEQPPKVDMRDITAIGPQARHVTTISMAQKAFSRFIQSRDKEDPMQISDVIKSLLLHRLDFLIEDIDKGSINALPREEIIKKFFEYFNTDPSMMSGVRSREIAENIGARIFRLYSKAPYICLPEEGNTPAISNESSVATNALKLFEQYDLAASKGKSLQDKEMEELINQLYLIFDYKPLDPSTKQERLEAIFGAVAITNPNTRSSQIPFKLHKDYDIYVKNAIQNVQLELQKIKNKNESLKALKERIDTRLNELEIKINTTKVSAEDKKRFLNLKMTVDELTGSKSKKPKGEDFTVEDIKVVRANLNKIVESGSKKALDKCIEAKLKAIKKLLHKDTLNKADLKNLSETMNVFQIEHKSENKYNNAVVNAWRYDDEPHERLYEVTARHLNIFFLLCPALDEHHRLSIINNFINKIATDYKMEEKDKKELQENVMNRIKGYFFDYENTISSDIEKFFKTEISSVVDELVLFYKNDVHEFVDELLLQAQISQEEREQDKEIIESDSMRIHAMEDMEDNVSAIGSENEKMDVEQVSIAISSEEPKDTPSLAIAEENEDNKDVSDMIIERAEMGEIREATSKNNSFAEAVLPKEFDKLNPRLQEIDYKKLVEDIESWQQSINKKMLKNIYDEINPLLINKNQIIFDALIEKFPLAKDISEENFKIISGHLGSAKPLRANDYLAIAKCINPAIVTSDKNINESIDKLFNIAHEQDNIIFNKINEKNDGSGNISRDNFSILMKVWQNNGYIESNAEYVLNLMFDEMKDQLIQAALFVQIELNIKDNKPEVAYNLIKDELKALLESEETTFKRDEYLMSELKYGEFGSQLSDDGNYSDFEEEIFTEKSKRSTRSQTNNSLPIKVYENIGNQSDKADYLLQSHDINYLANYLIQDENIVFLEVQQAHLNDPLIGLKVSFEDIGGTVQKALNDGNGVVSTFNKDGNHWVAFRLVPTENNLVVFYKDSMGNPPPPEFLDAVKTLETESSKVIIFHDTQKEQYDSVNCGIFALKNMQILAGLQDQQIEDWANEGKPPEFYNPDPNNSSENQKYTEEYADSLNSVRREYGNIYLMHSDQIFLKARENIAIVNSNQDEIEIVSYALSYATKITDPQMICQVRSDKGDTRYLFLDFELLGDSKEADFAAITDFLNSQNILFETEDYHIRLSRESGAEVVNKIFADSSNELVEFLSPSPSTPNNTNEFTFDESMAVEDHKFTSTKNKDGEKTQFSKSLLSTDHPKDEKQPLKRKAEQLDNGAKKGGNENSILTEQMKFNPDSTLKKAKLEHNAERSKETPVNELEKTAPLTLSPLPAKLRMSTVNLASSEQSAPISNSKLVNPPFAPNNKSCFYTPKNKKPQIMLKSRDHRSTSSYSVPDHEQMSVEGNKDATQQQVNLSAQNKPSNEGQPGNNSPHSNGKGSIEKKDQETTTHVITPFRGPSNK